MELPWLYISGVCFAGFLIFTKEAYEAGTWGKGTLYLASAGIVFNIAVECLLKGVR